MSNTRRKPNYLMLLVLVLFTKAIVSFGQMGWSAGARPVKLNCIPGTIENWNSIPLPMDSESQRLLQPDAYLWRRYQSESEPPVELFVVYGHSKNTFHSPGFCLPGGGWQVVHKRPISFDFNTGKLSMTLFQMHRKGSHALVLFCFIAGERSTSSLYRHNWNLLVDRIHHRANGGALVRLVLPMQEGEEEALDCARRFSRSALPPLLDELDGKN